MSAELADVAKSFTTPRRTVLLESAGQPVTVSAGALEVPDEPCRVLLSSTGLLARTTDGEPLASGGPRAKHDLVVSSVLTTARAEVGAVTSAGRVVRLGVLDLPALPRTASAPNLAGGAQLSEFLQLARDERVLALVSLGGPGIALGTEQGVVKRVVADYPSNKADFEVVRLEAGDRVVGAVDLADEGADLVFVTSSAQVLRFGRRSVRPQGRAAAGMAGIRLGAGEQVVFFGAVDAAADNVLVTVAGPSDALPGTVPGSAKVTSLSAYPGKGRATGGVRCQRFLRGEDRLCWRGPGPRPVGPRARRGCRSSSPTSTSEGTRPAPSCPPRSRPSDERLRRPARGQRDVRRGVRRRRAGSRSPRAGWPSSPAWTRASTRCGCSGSARATRRSCATPAPGSPTTCCARSCSPRTCSASPACSSCRTPAAGWPSSPTTRSTRLIQERAGIDTRSLDFGTETDQEGTLRRDLQRIRSYPLLPPGLVVGGAIYDVRTGPVSPFDLGDA